jgi:hypothetical protein
MYPVSINIYGFGGLPESNFMKASNLIESSIQRTTARSHVPTTQLLADIDREMLTQSNGKNSSIASFVDSVSIFRAQHASIHGSTWILFISSKSVLVHKAHESAEMYMTEWQRVSTCTHHILSNLNSPLFPRTNASPYSLLLAPLTYSAVFSSAIFMYPSTD